jgi:hypothetical protein
MRAANIGFFKSATDQNTFDPNVLTWVSLSWANDPDWTPPADGGAVSSWRDDSGNGYNLVNADGATQPVFDAVNANFNNRSSIYFDGTANRFLSATITQAQPFSIVCVGNITGGSGSRYVVNWASSNRVIGSNGSSNWTANNLVGASVDSGDKTQILIGNGASSILYINGVVEDNTGGASFTVDKMRIGGSSGGGTLTGSVAFIGLYNGIITDDPNWNTFKTAIDSYYGVTL